MNFCNYAASIVFTCKSASERSCTSITVITQIRTSAQGTLIDNEWDEWDSLLN